MLACLCSMLLMSTLSQCFFLNWLRKLMQLGRQERNPQFLYTSLYKQENLLWISRLWGKGLDIPAVGLEVWRESSVALVVGAVAFIQLLTCCSPSTQNPFSSCFFPLCFCNSAKDYFPLPNKQSNMQGLHKMRSYGRWWVFPRESSSCLDVPFHFSVWVAQSLLEPRAWQSGVEREWEQWALPHRKDWWWVLWGRGQEVLSVDISAFELLIILQLGKRKLVLLLHMFFVFGVYDMLNMLSCMLWELWQHIQSKDVVSSPILWSVLLRSVIPQVRNTTESCEVHSVSAIQSFSPFFMPLFPSSLHVVLQSQNKCRISHFWPGNTVQMWSEMAYLQIPALLIALQLLVRSGYTICQGRIISSLCRRC